jgi:hypothetical protein
MEAAMDDEKSIAGKLANAISKAAGSVKSVASTLVDKASNAAQHAMEANAQKISRIPPAKTGPGQVAATANEQIDVPDAAAMPRKSKAAKPATKSANKAATKPAATKTKKAAKKSSVRASEKAKRKSKKQEF